MPNLGTPSETLEASHLLKMSLSLPKVPPPSLEHPFYIYCDTESLVTQLSNDLASYTSDSRRTPIFLDCKGRDLGRMNGKLGLVQIGIAEHVYLVDVIAYPESLLTLKDILENPKIEKVVWDGRNDYSELWHGHGINMKPVLDLQLIHIHATSHGWRRGFNVVDGVSKVFSAANCDSGFNPRGSARHMTANKQSTMRLKRNTDRERQGSG